MALVCCAVVHPPPLQTGAGTPQPEVAAVMAWSKQHDFQLSASLHQGALVANYPFDSCDTQVCPDGSFASFGRPANVGNVL
jgi:hypothetical protein